MTSGAYLKEASFGYPGPASVATSTSVSIVLVIPADTTFRGSQFCCLSVKVKKRTSLIEKRKSLLKGVLSTARRRELRILDLYVAGGSVAGGRVAKKP